MRGEQDGVAPRKRANQIANGDHLMRVEAAGRFVQHQDLGVAQQCLRDRDALAKPAGQLARQQRHHRCQIEPCCGRIHRRSCRSAAQTLDAGHEVEKLADPHVVVERRVLGHVTYRAADGERVAHHVMAGYFDAPGSRHKIAGEHAKNRALARTIRSEQADNLALLDGKGNVRDGAPRPVPLGYLLSQHNGSHRASQNPNAGSDRAGLILEHDPGHEGRDPVPSKQLTSPLNHS